MVSYQSPPKTTLPSSDVSVRVPDMVFPDPEKVVVAELSVKVVLLVKFPEIVSRPDAGAETAPEPVLMVKFVVEALFWKVLVPPPSNSTLLKDEEAVRLFWMF